MRFLSVCSGIEAASVAWTPLGWKAWAFAEIEPFPCAVLAHHYPDVPNLGDMTNFKAWPDGAIDLLCGGTPCQSFSVAGLRKGLDDPRGNLMLTFGAIAARYRPRWLVWENVPGVLSSNEGRDFGAFLGLLGHIGYGYAYRVLDAQYFGVAQRRRRVFVVGCLGDWRSAAAVLFERHSLSGHPAPRREAPQGAAAGAARSVALRGREGGGTAELGGEFADCLRASGGGGDKPHVLAFGGNRTSGSIDVTPALLAQPGSGWKGDFESETFLVGPLPFETTQVTSAANRSNPQPGDPCHPLAAGACAPAIAFSAKDHGADASVDLAPTLRAMGHAGSHANGGGQMAVAFHGSQDPDVSGDVTHPVGRNQGQETCVAYTTKLHNTASNNAGKLFEERATCLDANSPPPALLTAMQVRRLTPRECERLQGFPDDYTAIPWRTYQEAQRKGISYETLLAQRGMTLRGPSIEECPDGPRYKALGNSWAIPPVRWIGERIEAVEAVHTQRRAAA